MSRFCSGWCEVLPGLVQTGWQKTRQTTATTVWGVTTHQLLLHAGNPITFLCKQHNCSEDKYFVEPSPSMWFLNAFATRFPLENKTLLFWEISCDLYGRFVSKITIWLQGSGCWRIQNYKKNFKLCPRYHSWISQLWMIRKLLVCWEL